MTGAPLYSMAFCATLPSLIIACLATFLLRRYAARWNLLDEPGPRKNHARPTPTGGGLAIWLAVVVPFAVGSAVLWYLDLTGADVSDSVRRLLGGGSLAELAATHVDGLYSQLDKLWTLLFAATVLMLLGLADDLRSLDWRLRIGAQTIVAIVMVSQGWRLTVYLDMPLVTAALSVMWIVGLINSFNMLDNMDGLSAGVAAIASAILAAVMLLGATGPAGEPQLFVGGFLLVLCGALVGFLWHNHAPARIFMGDAGSYFVGFCVACATLSATFAGENLPRHAIMAPLCVLAVPLYDTATVVAIRLRQGRSPFVGDRSHFSHRLVEMGLAPWQAVWTIYLATATCGLGALLLYQVDFVGAVIVLVIVGCVLAIIGVLESSGRSGRGQRPEARGQRSEDRGRRKSR